MEEHAPAGAFATFLLQEGELTEVRVVLRVWMKQKVWLAL
jgi:hypothetical protein